MLLAQVPDAGAELRVLRPAWYPGDTWIFRWTDSDGNRGTVTRRFVGIVSLQHQSAYISDVKIEWTNAFGDKFSRVVRETRRPDWRLIAPVGDFLIPWSTSLLRWPLVKGAMWKASLPAGSYRSGLAEVRVGPEERLALPIGRVTAIRVHASYHKKLPSGDSVGFEETVWIAPQLRIWVKATHKAGEFKLEAELVKYFRRSAR